jgi:bifunctional ADP-heptose synthase (sugar kinase/adenylyltransferase)
MLTESVLESILSAIPAMKVGVLGDLFLDRYLDIDGELTEPSLETGLDAYQVVRIRSIPGAAGTIINNLAALAVGTIRPISVIGDDGEGYELSAALAQLPGVKDSGIFTTRERRTPTYTKPMLFRDGHAACELNRLDIKNRAILPREAEDAVSECLHDEWPELDALIVLDQVSEANCGVVTDHIRDQLAVLGRAFPARLILADSRERIGLFRDVWLKPNRRECVRAADIAREPRDAARMLAERCGRPVFCTFGEEGILVIDPRFASAQEELVPCRRVDGPIDPVGAGDSVSAALTCAIAASASLTDAAAFANLVASITVQQIGTTGTASPQQVRERWQELG